MFGWQRHKKLINKVEDKKKIWSKMKSFDLVIVYGNKSSERAVYSLMSGKNLVGTNIKCSTQMDLGLIKPMHFEILVYKSGRLTLIPLSSGLQIESERGKRLTELDSN